MTTYMGYQIRLRKDYFGRTVYDIYTENHYQGGQTRWVRTSGNYQSLQAAKAACRAHFGRL